MQVAVDPTLDELGAQGTESFIEATRAWQVADAAVPEFEMSVEETDEIGYFPGRKNKNTVRYAKGGEPLAKGALAITVVTADAATGRILDADIVVNGVYDFGDATATSGRSSSDLGKGKGPKQDEQAPFDLQSVFTHEMGHFLGLKDDLQDQEATMYLYSAPGDTSKRSLSATDQTAISSLYVPGMALEDSADPAAAGGCGIAAASPRRSSLAWVSVAGALAVGTLIARREQFSRRSRRVAAFVAVLPLGLTMAPQARATDLEESIVAQATISEVKSQWSGGLILSEVRLSALSCEAGPCAEVPRALTVAGGELDSLVQTVGHSAVPTQGQRLLIRATRRGLQTKLESARVQRISH